MTIERGRSDPKRASVLPLAATVLVFACSGDNGTAPGGKVPPSKVPPIGVASPLGDVKVTTQTSGIDLDTDGYVIQVDSPWDYEVEPTKIAANGIVDLRGVFVGERAARAAVHLGLGVDPLEVLPFVLADPRAREAAGLGVAGQGPRQ